LYCYKRNRREAEQDAHPKKAVAEISMEGLDRSGFSAPASHSRRAANVPSSKPVRSVEEDHGGNGTPRKQDDFDARAYRAHIDEDLEGLGDDSDTASRSASIDYKLYRKEERLERAA